MLKQEQTAGTGKKRLIKGEAWPQVSRRVGPLPGQYRADRQDQAGNGSTPTLPLLVFGRAISVKFITGLHQESVSRENIFLSSMASFI